MKMHIITQGSFRMVGLAGFALSEKLLLNFIASFTFLLGGVGNLGGKERAKTWIIMLKTSIGLSTEIM